LNAKKVGIIGITYHKDSDDLRNSQVIELAKRLIGKQLSVLIYDNVDFNNLLGANKDFVEALPFTLKDLFVSSLEDLIETSDVLIIAHAKPGLEELIRKLSQNKYCIDLGDLYHSRNAFSNYDGICW
jgi:GDP-mannose 6-dehydrogenase